MPQGIDELDARAMVRLVAQVATAGTDHATARELLMDGLVKLTGADCWVWTLAYLHPDRPPAYVSINHGGFTEERYTKLLKASEHPDMAELTAPFAQELSENGRLLTRLRQEIDAAARFSSTGAYPLWIEADIAPMILSARPLNDQCLSFVGLYRRADDSLFGERERQIAHIMLEEVSWLHEIGWPEDFGSPTPSLSRRPRLVLNLLLEGHSRKFIAAELGLSVHTVSDYVKEIYRAFGVQSHAELMRRYMGVKSRGEKAG